MVFFRCIKLQHAQNTTIHHCLPPNCIDEQFSPNNTKYNNVPEVPGHNRNIIKYTVCLAGPKIWKSVAICIPNISILFKHPVKAMLNCEMAVS